MSKSTPKKPSSFSKFHDHRLPLYNSLPSFFDFFQRDCIPNNLPFLGYLPASSQFTSILPDGKYTSQPLSNISRKSQTKLTQPAIFTVFPSDLDSSLLGFPCNDAFDIFCHCRIVLFRYCANISEAMDIPAILPRRRPILFLYRCRDFYFDLYLPVLPLIPALSTGSFGPRRITPRFSILHTRLSPNESLRSLKQTNSRPAMPSKSSSLQAASHFSRRIISITSLHTYSLTKSSLANPFTNFASVSPAFFSL